MLCYFIIFQPSRSRGGLSVPNWQPNWDDVSFDHTAAANYAAACRRTSATINHVAHERNHLATAARVDWEGPTRDRFDSDLRRWTDQAGDLAARLVDVAWRVEAAADAARAEQAARSAARDRWWAEQQAEQQAEQLRAEQLAEQLRAEQLRAEQRVGA
jgi:uncharacterized protein YukE